MPSFRKFKHHSDRSKEKELNKNEVTALHPEGFLDGPVDDNTSVTSASLATGNGKKAKRGFLYGLVRRILGGDSGAGSLNSSSQTLANSNLMPHPQAPLSPPQSPESSPPHTSGQFKYFPPMPSRMNSSYSTARVPPSPASTTSTSNTSRTASQGSSMSCNSEKRKVLRKSSVASRNAPGSTNTQGREVMEPPVSSASERKVLTNSQLAELLSGAPQFQLKPAGSGENAPTFSPLIPSVNYQYNSELQLVGHSDHVAFPAHPSFSLCVATPDHSHGLIDNLDPLPSEMPPMSSFQGLEVGSCGWEHFLMNPLADIHNTGDDYEERDGLLDLVDEGGRERGMAMDGRELAGVMRSVEVGWVVERLKELGELYWVGKSRGEAVSDDGSSESAAFKTVIIPGTPQTETASTISEQSSGTVTGQNGKIGILSKYTPLELYTNLFTQLLYPPTRIDTNDFHDPFSLKVQIASLTQALGMTRVWLDFSLVEWRIRLGQLLWGGKWSQIADEDYSGNNTERVWLLLQILMACELVVRLDAVANSDFDVHGEQGIGGIGGNGQSKEELFKYFRDIRKRKVEWDIVLARRWLENVHLVEREPLVTRPDLTDNQNTSTSLAAQSASPPKKKGWFSGLSGTEAPAAKYEPSTSKSNPAYDALIIPQNQETQLSGLLHFARQINWPHVDSLAQVLVDDLISFNNNHHTQHGYIPPSAPTTPSVDTPRLLSSPQKEGAGGALATVAAAMGVGGYFTTAPARPRRLRELSSRSSIKSRSSSLIVRRKSSTAALMRNNTMGSGGWLSRSWFTGLVLPGESMVHLLISALLENDAHVGERIGWEAELYGGFILRNSNIPEADPGMWWSSFSIVGKVLGDYGGGKECMGWIGIGKGVRVLSSRDVEDDEDLADVEDVDGWVAIRTRQPTEEQQEREQNLLERVDKPREVFRMSCALGRGWKEGISVVDIDFTIPRLPAVIPQDMNVELEGLIFRRAPSDNNDTDSEAEQTDDSEDEMMADAGVRSCDVSISFLVTEKAETPMLLPPLAIRGSIDYGMAAAVQSATKRLVFNLSYDVTFITSYPCFPPTALLGDESPGSPPLSPGMVPKTHIHPLHKSHLYTVQPLPALATLPAPDSILPVKNVSGEGLKDSILAARKSSILVIDASTSGQTGEVLAKSWCADRGVGAALLAREGRSCLSCAVREAAGLGVAVVVWLAKRS